MHVLKGVLAIDVIKFSLPLIQLLSHSKIYIKFASVSILSQNVMEKFQSEAEFAKILKLSVSPKY